MNTIVLAEPGRLEPVHRDLGGDLSPGMARVRVRNVGICGTDWHAYAGRQPFFTYPRVLGHELGVEVIEVADASSDLVPGDRCAVEPYLNCGTCIACRQGKGNCCEHLRVLGVHADGGMSEELVLPAAKLHRANDLDFEQLALVETLGIGCHAVQRSAATADDTALVQGAGPIGLSVVPFLQATGCRVAVVDVCVSRRRGVTDMLKVEHALAADEQLGASLREAFGGDLPTVVIDATGNRESMQNAFRLVAPGGRIVFVGLVQGEVAFDDPTFHKREATLLASRNALPGDFGRIIGLIREGRVDTRPWITHRGPLMELPKLLPQWRDDERPVLKAMAHLDGGGSF